MKVQILISLASLAFVLQTDAYIFGHRLHLGRNQSIKGNVAATNSPDFSLVVLCAPTFVFNVILFFRPQSDSFIAVEVNEPHTKILQFEPKSESEFKTESDANIQNCIHNFTGQQNSIQYSNVKLYVIREIQIKTYLARLCAILLSESKYIISY